MAPLVLVLLFAGDPDPTPRFKVTPGRKGDRVEVKHVKGFVVWNVYSSTGIGSVEVSLTGGLPPKKITIRFVKLRALESFLLRQGGLRVAGGLRHTEPARSYTFDEKGEVPADLKKVVATSTVTRVGDGIEVRMTFTKPGRHWKFEWIDAYRR